MRKIIHSCCRIVLICAIALVSSVCNADNLNLRHLTEAQRQVIAKGAAWGSIISLADGSLGVIVQRGRPLSEFNAVNVAMEWMRSIDGGKSWSDPVILGERLGPDGQLFERTDDNGYIVFQERNQALGQLPSGRIIVAYSRINHYYGPDGESRKAPDSLFNHKNLGVFYTWSDDFGATWESAHTLPSGMFGGKHGAVTPHGRIITLKDGTALMSLYGSLNPEYSNSSSVPPGTKAIAGVIRSRDNGQSWGDISLILHKEDPFSYEETSLCIIDQDKLLAHIRTPSGNVDQYISDDGGRIWRLVGAVTEKDQHPAGAFRLVSGKILLTWGNRRPPFGAAAMLSSDEGQTWDYTNAVSLAWDAPGRNCGYANGTQAADGSIFVVYYVMPNVVNYRELWKQSTIYIVHFTEEQLLQVSQQVKSSIAKRTKNQ
ncbi:MAG: exo-alpha-sialidase [Legionella sp.]|nr:MAG: exo-alpha-sialidase [Legionella sp.]